MRRFSASAVAASRKLTVKRFVSPRSKRSRSSASSSRVTIDLLLQKARLLESGLQREKRVPHLRGDLLGEEALLLA